MFQENGAFPDLDFILKDEPGNNDKKCNSFFSGYKVNKSKSVYQKQVQWEPQTLTL